MHQGYGGAHWGMRVFVLGILAVVQNIAHADVTFVHTDHLGTPVAYSNAQGQVIGEESTTPFGESLNAPTSNNLPAFTGHVRDGSTGLIYMQARYYDPVVGRFMSTDPMGFRDGGVSYFNRYSYTANNPLNLRDPDGRCVTGVFTTACILGAVAVISAIYVAVRIDESYDENEQNQNAMQQHNEKMKETQSRLDSGEIDAMQATQELYESLEDVNDAAESSREIATELGEDIGTTALPASEIADAVGMVGDAMDGELQDTKANPKGVDDKKKESRDTELPLEDEE